MVGPQLEVIRGTSAATARSGPELSSFKGRLLLVENERFLRDSLGLLFGENGYEVSFAVDGREAMRLLRSEVLPTVIILDLRMPVMNGWEFRAIQKEDPALGLIPVIVMSADLGPKALAISADGYLRKPFDSHDILAAVQRVVSENAARVLARQDETDRLASLGRVVANVGHEINNPLTSVMLNLQQSADELRSLLDSLGAQSVGSSPDISVEHLKGHIVNVIDMLQECEVGAERIRRTVTDLQQLSERPVYRRSPVDVQELLEKSASSVSTQIRRRARLTTSFGTVARVVGHPGELGQVFSTLLVNAAQSIAEGDAERNEIQITTRVDAGAAGAELVVEIRDSGAGIAPDLVSRVFEPYFTTKPLGEGMGLGLSISRHTVNNHGGRLTVESELGQGTVFRVFLPLAK